MFKQIRLCVVLVQGMYIIFIDQTPAFHVFRKIHSLLALRTYFNTQFVHSVDDFLCVKIIYNTVYVDIKCCYILHCNNFVYSVYFYICD